MPVDPCIQNVGEYYSSHYLESTFAADVRQLAAKWRQLGSQAPPRRVQGLAQRYFRAKAQALDEDRPDRRWQVGEDLAGWHAHLLEALGYTTCRALDLPVEGDSAVVPSLGRLSRYNTPWLVICGTVFCLPDASLKEGKPSEDPLEMAPLPEQLSEAGNTLCAGDWSHAIGRVFTEEDSPRWVLFLAGSQILLLDKHTHAQGRYLAIDLDEAYGRATNAAPSSIWRPSCQRKPSVRRANRTRCCTTGSKHRVIASPMASQRTCSWLCARPSSC